ncbi:tetratricopeptide repeat protein [Helicobacter bizzozeronii]|uniref:tetratricopeptide repeat protein n=1 Tax=Helicobacter bizzozeronii TaxID=56877 RepID=UPI000CF076A2|nr:tetratricopeptide repeat protein [Helicobacter bizzozeronii]
MVFNGRVIKVVGALVLSVGLCYAQSHRGEKFLEKAHEYYQQKNYDKAFAYSKKAANAGEAQGYAMLGDLYANGQGVRQDYQKAATYFQKAGELGVANAYTGLGLIYANGHGVKQDDKKAVEYYQKAADMGDAGGTTF